MMFISRLLGTGLYTGFSPIAPGTAGSALALGLFLLLPRLEVGYYLLVIAVVLFVGVATATRLEEGYGHDASQINIDEIGGMLISLFMLPKTWLVLASAFLVFRLFDIIKPFPIDKLQSLPKGWGVMADDTVAGIYTNILMLVTVRLFQ